MQQNETVVYCLLVFAFEEVKQQPLQNHGLPLAKFVHQSSVPHIDIHVDALYMAHPILGLLNATTALQIGGYLSHNSQHTNNLNLPMNV